VGTRCADHVTPLYPQMLALGGGRSVGIVRSQTKATEFSFFYVVRVGFKVMFLRIPRKGTTPQI